LRHPGAPVWLPSPVFQRHVNRTATGNAEHDWLSYVRAIHLPPSLGSTLVIGCSTGALERALVRKESVGRITAVDADEAAVERARRQAERAGMDSISYAVLDPVRDPLPPSAWDAIIASDVVHHIPNLEGFYLEVHRALAPRGCFVFHEYVGPNRFQYTDERMDLIHRYFRLLPDRWRLDPSTGRCLWRRERIDAARLAQEDPAEAARSEELLPLARAAFLAEAEYPHGGGLIHPVLSGLVGNFREGLSEDERLLQVLCDAEEDLMKRGLLPSDFVIFVGRRRDTERSLPMT